MPPPVNDDDVSQNPASKAIENALQANLKLQYDLRCQIENISKEKSQNRLLAAKTTAMIGHVWSREYSQRTYYYKSMSNEFYTKFAKRLRKEYQQKEEPSRHFKPLLYSNTDHPKRKKLKPDHPSTKNDNHQRDTHSDTENQSIQNEPMPPDDNEDNNPCFTEKPIIPSKYLKQNWKTPLKCQYAWGYDENRRWHRRFFIDPAGTVPEDNSETKRRRIMEKGIPFKHLGSSWSASEIKKLKKFAEKVRSEMENDLLPICPKEQENGKTSVHTTTKAADTNMKHQVSDSMIDFTKVSEQAKLRTPDECRNKFLSCVAPASKSLPFTRVESIQIMELVQQNHGQVSWDVVAKSLGNNRTAYQCFQHFSTKLDTSRFQIQWTQYEDELLLRYIAACGPQFILNLRTASDMSIRLFPERSAKQILVRAHHSLVNPNYMYDKWSEDEERMLAMSIRVYCNAPSPTVLSARHFPNRSSKMVTEKWSRCLAPGYSSQPFTAAEDTALINAVKEAGDASNWKDIAQLFPSRRGPALKRRWFELAKTDDLIKSHGNAIKKRLARQGVVGKEALLLPDDIILCKKKT